MHGPMPMRRIPFKVLFLLSLGPCVLGILYLYFYPFVLGCQFPSPADFSSYNAATENQYPGSIGDTDPKLINEQQSISVTDAPFRLLVFADPQLEGNTALPRRSQGHSFPSFNSLKDEFQSADGLSISRAKRLVREFFLDDIRLCVRRIRKRLDLVGNDYYLRHIYRTMYWWSNPTHTTVLGDLLGSQWFTDKEFERRSDRYWDRVFRHALKTDSDKLSRLNDETGDVERVEELGSDPSWSRRLIHVAGNHDVGYAGDMDEHRVNRFETRFGPVNGAITFTLSPTYLNQSGNSALVESGIVPTLRIIALNSMNLDTPAVSSELQTESYRFLNAVMRTSKPHTSTTDAVILLTHIPLYKPEGVCTDPPMFSFFHGGKSGIREQNHLSDHVSWNHILKGVFGMRLDPTVDGTGSVVDWRPEGRKGVILAGHDHAGCDVLHYLKPKEEFKSVSEETYVDLDSNSESDIDQSDDPPSIPTPTFYALRTPFPNPLNPPASFDSNSHPPRYTPSPLREITARSMMGDYHGNTVLLSGWIDPQTSSWRFESQTCAMGKHHLWWTVHITALVVMGLGFAALVQKAVIVFQDFQGQQKLTRLACLGNEEKVSTESTVAAPLAPSPRSTQHPGLQSTNEKNSEKKVTI